MPAELADGAVGDETRPHTDARDVLTPEEHEHEPAGLVGERALERVHTSLRLHTDATDAASDVRACAVLQVGNPRAVLWQGAVHGRGIMSVTDAFVAGSPSVDTVPAISSDRREHTTRELA